MNVSILVDGAGITVDAPLGSLHFVKVSDGTESEMGFGPCPEPLILKMGEEAVLSVSKGCSMMFMQLPAEITDSGALDHILIQGPNPYEEDGD
jgi:hypothetical protein